MCLAGDAEGKAPIAVWVGTPMAMGCRRRQDPLNNDNYKELYPYVHHVL